MSTYRFGGAFSFGSSHRSNFTQTLDKTPGPGSYETAKTTRGTGSTFSRFPKMLGNKQEVPPVG